MKIINLFNPTVLLGVATMVSLASCEKDLDTYQGENGIYFDTRYNGAELMTDTIGVSWGMKPSAVNSQVINIPVRLFGNTAPVDRKFNIEIVNDPADPNSAVEGVDFIMPQTEYSIPANEAEVIIPVTVLRRHDLHLGNRHITIKLIENPQLKFLYSRSVPIYEEETPDDPESEIEDPADEESTSDDTKYRPIDYQRVILMDEKFPIPVWWIMRGQPYFGNWSMTKASLICDVMGINREQWLEPATLSAGYLKFCGRYMHNYLLENPHYEDDGSLMVMGEQSVY